MQKRSVGKVISLFISDKSSGDKLKKSTLIFDKKGILNDKYYDTNIQRSVLVTSLESYKLALQHDIDMPHGTLGENILVDFNPYHLKQGERLFLGTVILEISQNCTICDHLSSIDKRLPTLLKNDRGIFAKVVQEGNVKREDVISM